MAERSVRVGAALASLALLAAAFASPAAAKKVKCGAFASSMEGAADAPLVKVTPKHTEEKPLTVEVEHGPALYPVATEDKYVNLQVVAPNTALYIREEFPPNQDIDLYLYDSAGEEAASSGAFNPAPVPGVLDAGGNGGATWESINGFAVPSCSPWTINSHAYMTPGTTATLKIWLGQPAG